MVISPPGALALPGARSPRDRARKAVQQLRATPRQVFSLAGMRSRRGSRPARHPRRTLLRPRHDQGRPRRRPARRAAARPVPRCRDGVPWRSRVPVARRPHAVARGRPAEDPPHRPRAGRAGERVRAHLPSMPSARRGPRRAARRRVAAPVPGVRHGPVPRALPRPLRFHDRRHTTATLLLRAGVDPHRVQRIMRHRDLRTTLGTYGHLDVEDLRAAVATLPADVGGSAPSVPAGKPRSSFDFAQDERARATADRLVTRLLPLAQGERRRAGAPGFPWNDRPFRWSGKTDLNPRPSPWQGDALPLSYSRKNRTKVQRYRKSPGECQGA